MSIEWSTMQVEIWSDIACPWCYVGKRRFETALADFDHADDVSIIWRSFELSPDAPAELEGDMAERLAAKYGMTVEQAREMEANMTATAADEGLDYHLDIRRAANTFDGHRLIHLAEQHGLGDVMKERLLAAHFSEGRLVSDHAELTELGAEVGLDREEVRAMLASDRFGDDVRADETTARQYGISGVPTFIIDSQIGVSGAQSPDVLLALLQQGWDRRAPAIVTADGDSCGVDGC
jgi:predicted DsbA family dithiol-disulfide isomerase